MSARAALVLVCFAALGAGCTEEEEPPPLPAHPCHDEDLRLDVAPPDGEYGDLVDGSDLWCGNPPQGGAPYSPLRIRLRAPDTFQDGVELEMIVTDVTDGSELGYTTLTTGLTCANVGDNEGFWVGSEAHLRYPGVVLEDLPGREAELTVRAVPLEGAEPVLEESWQVWLTQ